MEFKDIVVSRYATKKFDGKTIPEDKVDALFDLIRFAPSAFNFQPWKIKVVTDKETKEKLAPAAWNQTQITSCSHLLVFCADSDLNGIINKIEANMKKAGAAEKGAPYIAMLSGFATKLSEEQKVAFAKNQVYIALGNALNGAKSLGFDSCPMEGFNSVAFGEILNLPKNLTATVLCPIGYAADAMPPKMRLEKKDIFF